MAGTQPHVPRAAHTPRFHTQAHTARRMSGSNTLLLMICPALFLPTHTVVNEDSKNGQHP